MQSKLSIKLLFLFILLTLNVFAIDGKVRVFVKSNETIYTSQKVTVSVELLSNAFSITDAKITFPASNKYIVQAPKSASYLGQEKIEDEDWQMVHYEYQVYAMQSGKIEIPSLLITFTASMGYGQPKKEFILQSEALSFDVKVPKGVKSGQFVLVTDHFTLSSEIKPEKKKLIVGDAVELTVLQKANDIPDILLTPIIYTSNALLRVYTKEPELKSDLKGKYDVSRTDRFTFVAIGEGNVTLPEQERLWFNMQTQKIHVEKIPSVTYEIFPDPQIAIDAKKAQQKQRLFYIIVIVFLLLILYKIFASTVSAFLSKRKRVYELSEAGKFDAVLNSIKNDDSSGVYRDFYQWLTVASPKLSRLGFRGIEKIQPSFSASLRELEVALSVQQKAFDTTGFINEVKKLRTTLLKEQRNSKQVLPKNINPNPLD